MIYLSWQKIVDQFFFFLPTIILGESVQNYVMLQNLNRFYFGDNNDDDAKNSSQYKSGIQLFTMAISNIFKIKKNSKFNDFKVRFYIECQNQQFSPTAFENYLVFYIVSLKVNGISRLSKDLKCYYNLSGNALDWIKKTFKETWYITN